MPMAQASYPKHIPLIDPNCANRSDFVNLFKFQCYEPAAMKHVTIHLYKLYTDIHMVFLFSSLLHPKHEPVTMIRIETMPSYGGYFNA